MRSSRSPLLRRRLTGLAAVAATTALVAGLAPAPSSAALVDEPVTPDQPVSAVASTGEAAALAALDQVESLFEDAAASGTGAGGEGRPGQGATASEPLVEPTMALRELANTRASLRGDDRARAEALLRRPTSGNGDGTLTYSVPEAKPSCAKNVCIHYVRRGKDAPALADANRNGVPDYVDLARTTVQSVHSRYVRAGYRAPRSDRGRGGNDKLDVYLGNLGGRGIYGYCTSDQPEPDPTPATFDRWAYCALDNDYAEFPTNTRRENLQVTAAHEYFHAVQYAYDRYEDPWILEATAAWVEDEMYDGVNDNRQYFRVSPLALPGVPLDTFGSNFHYGTWTYFRFLTERFPRQKGGLPRFVLDVFRQADGARGGPDLYSWAAVNRVLRTKGTTGAVTLGRYAAANRRPQASYSEGRAWPKAPLGRKPITLRPGNREVTSTPRMDHLTTWTARVAPSRLRGKGWKLRVGVDLGPARTSPVALVTRFPTRGRPATTRVALNRTGGGVITLGFGNAGTEAVEVTLVNGSGRFRCWRRMPYSCAGRPLDDGQRARLVVRAFR